MDERNNMNNINQTMNNANEKETNEKISIAILLSALSIVFWMFPIVNFVLSIMATKKAKKLSAVTKKAHPALAMGIVGISLAALSIIVYFIIGCSIWLIVQGTKDRVYDKHNYKYNDWSDIYNYDDYDNDYNYDYDYDDEDNYNHDDEDDELNNARNIYDYFSNHDDENYDYNYYDLVNRIENFNYTVE